MINVSDHFKQSIVADVRHTYAKVVAHIVDPDIVYSTPTYNSMATYADVNGIYDGDGSVLKVATLERNRWLLDGTFALTDTTTEAGTGYASQSTSVATTRQFSTSPYVQLNFTGVTLLQTCTIIFSDGESDGVPESFTVEILQSGGTVVFSTQIDSNTDRTVAVEGFSVSSPVAIKVTCLKMTLPYKRFRVAEIVAGVHETWTGDDLASLEVKQQTDLTNATLPYGTCILVMDNLAKRFDPRNKNGLFNSLEERQGIDVYIGAGVPAEFIKVGHYYLSNKHGWSTSNNAITLQWELVDIIGLLSDRAYTVPATLPTTLDGWIADIMAGFDNVFANAYVIDADLQGTAVVAESADLLDGKTIGDMLRHICEYLDIYAVADPDGNLWIRSFPAGGNDYNLDNLAQYPEISANQDINEIIITIQDSTFGASHTTVGGNSTVASDTRQIDNPFITTLAEAQRVGYAAVNHYGGTKIALVGRGDPASEIGDVDAVQLDESNAASGRRYMQDFRFQNGVLMGCNSALIQANGALSYSNYEILTVDQTYSFPAGVTEARILLVGGGHSGEAGTDGTFSSDGKRGANGSGGNIYTADITFTDGSTFAVTIGATEGGASLFGTYTSANGRAFEHGYGDLLTGKTYGRTGVDTPLPNTGDGGAGGAGGKKGERHYNPKYEGWIVDKAPTQGRNGKAGATGVVVVYWNE